MDASLRALERALAASPGDEPLRRRLALAAQRAGDVPRACALLGVQLRVSPRRLPPLAGRGWRPMRLQEVRALAAEALAALDVVGLIEAFPRRRDGRLAAGRVVLLRRHAARALIDCPHEQCEGRCGLPALGGRLFLWAWTPGRRPRRARSTVELIVELGIRRADWSPRRPLAAPPG